MVSLSSGNERGSRSGTVAHVLVLLVAAFLALSVLVGLTSLLEPWAS